jgi:hypothetical protein
MRPDATSWNTYLEYIPGKMADTLPPLTASELHRLGGLIRGMYDLLHESSLTGEQPWASLYAEGHGEHWGPAADYIEAHLERWTASLLD